MSLLSESVTTVSEFQTLETGEFRVADLVAVEEGVNFVHLTGVCTPTALTTNYLLLDSTGKTLNLKELLILEVYISSNPSLVADASVDFTLVGLTEDLSSYAEYTFPSIAPKATSINGKFYQNIGYSTSSSSADYVKNYPYPIPGIRPTGSGTITSGSVIVTFRCASFS